MELLFALTLVAGLPPVVGPSGIVLERLADSTMQLPGTTGEYLFDGQVPVPCGAGVVFWAFKNQPAFAGSWAYHATSDGVEILVDEETTIVGSQQTFDAIADIECITERRFALIGQEPPPAPVSSVYEWASGQVALLQSGGVDVDGRFLGAIDELSTSFFGLGMLGRLQPGGGALVVKPFNSAPMLVADLQTVLPGQSEPVDIYSLPLMVGSDLAFRARTFLDVGLYRWSKGSGIAVLADDSTPVPGAPGTFASIGEITALDAGVAFEAAYSGGSGIFLATHGGGIEPLVVPGDTTADGDVITAASNPTGAGDLLSFTGTTTTNPVLSLFVRTSGRIERILGTGDVIEGVQVGFVNARADRHSVAIHVQTFEGGNQVHILYRATFGTALDIPALSHAGLAVLVIALVAAAGVLLRR